MAADNFFARWSRHNTGHRDNPAETNSSEREPNTAVAPASTPLPVSEAERPIPTQLDVDKLTHESDFSVFMGKGVDEQVKRGAMKKLFSDPQFNVMDGLDIYIDDYTKFEAMTPSVLASLNHVKDLLDPLSRLERTISGLLETPETIATVAQPLLVPTEEPALDQQVLADAADQERVLEQNKSEETSNISEVKNRE